MSDAFKDFVARREAQIRGGKGSSNWFWLLLAAAFAITVVILVLRGDPNTGPVNPNTATMEQLQSLHGVGPEIAKGIISARPFTKSEDLIRVPGIGAKTLEKMKPRLVFE
jgi:competence protein ComEA